MDKARLKGMGKECTKIKQFRIKGLLDIGYKLIYWVFYQEIKIKCGIFELIIPIIPYLF